MPLFRECLGIRQQPALPLKYPVRLFTGSSLDWYLSGARLEEPEHEEAKGEKEAEAKRSNATGSKPVRTVTTFTRNVSTPKTSLHPLLLLLSLLLSPPCCDTNMHSRCTATFTS